MTYEELVKENQKLLQRIRQFTIQIQDLTDQNNELKRMLFGIRREYTTRKKVIDKDQVSLFEDKDNPDVELQQKAQKELKKVTIEDDNDTDTTQTEKKPKVKRAGILRSKILDVEKTLKIEALDDSNRFCPICHGELTKIGEKIEHQELIWKPGHFEVLEHGSTVYKCKICGHKGAEKETPTFVSTKVPKALLPHSFVSPSLATEIIYTKYYLDAPLYRQEKMWFDRGLALPRNVTSNWIIKISEYYLEALCNSIFKRIKEENIVAHSDETTTQCNKEIGREASSTSYMWGFCSGEEELHRAVIFKYNPSRSQEVANKFLEGFNGILVTDRI